MDLETFGNLRYLSLTFHFPHFLPEISQLTSLLTAGCSTEPGTTDGHWRCTGSAANGPPGVTEKRAPSAAEDQVTDFPGQRGDPQQGRLILAQTVQLLLDWLEYA